MQEVQEEAKIQVSDDPDQTGAATAADVEPGRRPPLTEKKKTLPTAFGIPVADDQHSLTAGSRGPVLVQDLHLLERLAHFDRERIPVHSTSVDEIRKS